MEPTEEQQKSIPMESREQDAENKTLVSDSEQTSSHELDTIDVEKAAVVNDMAVKDGQPVRTITGVKWWLVVFANCSSIFLFGLDNTIVADIQADIVLQFDAIDKIAWISVAFMLAAVASNLVWGKLYFQFNTKWLYVVCIVGFEIGSAICGAAPNMNALIIGRVICGLFGVGAYIGVMTLLAMTTTVQERPAYLGLTGLTWGLGSIFGPVIGGAFATSSATWRWAFYINLCIGALLAPIILFFMPSPDPRPGVKFLDRLREIDAIGSVLVVGGITSVIMAINFGNVLYSWNSGQEIAMFVVGFAVLIVFGIQQTFTIGTTKERRIFPVEFLQAKLARTMIISACCTAAAACCLFLPVYFIPILFEFTKGDDAIKAAVHLLPFIIVTIVMCIVSGGVLSKNGFYMPWFLIGGICIVIGSALMFTVHYTTSVAKIYGYSVILGFGVGCFIQVGFSIGQVSVSPEQAPVANGFIAFGQNLGGTFAMAIANAVFVNDVQHKISQILPDIPRSQIQYAMAGVGNSFIDSLDLVQRTAVLSAIVDSISNQYILAITAGALVVVLSLLMKREKLVLEPGASGA